MTYTQSKSPQLIHIIVISMGAINLIATPLIGEIHCINASRLTSELFAAILFSLTLLSPTYSFSQLWRWHRAFYKSYRAISKSYS